MRLIDADALVAQLKADAEQMEEPLIKMCTYAAINDVKHAPTVEPEPQWIPCDMQLPEQDREFIKLTVRNSNGRPYYSIIYLELDDNGVGHDFEGYSSYSLDVISDYLKKYFMPSVQPELHYDEWCNTCKEYDQEKHCCPRWNRVIRKTVTDMKSQKKPERKPDTIQKFHDYQVEWLKSHYDIEFEPQLEEMIIRFLHDTANRYMMEEGG